MRIAQRQISSTQEVGRPRPPFHLKEPRRDSTAKANRRGSGRLFRGDRLLLAHEEPPLGAHLVTPRFAYVHHGVYVGAGSVVHYGAYASLWSRGPVEEIPLACFASGHPVWVRARRRESLPAAEIVRRARSRLGEDRYRFFSNNCEHLSEWCVNGEHRSPQVERLQARASAVSRALKDLLRVLKPSSLRGDDCRQARTT